MINVVALGAPAAIVTLEQAKAQLRLDTADEDAYLDELIEAAQAAISPPDCHLGRAFGLQSFELRLSGFGHKIELPFPPLSAVTSVKYDDAAGVEQTTTNFRIIGLGGSAPARLAPVYGGSWPDVRAGEEAVRIRFTAGYAADAVDLAPARQALLLMIAFLFENREASPPDALNGTVAMMLGRYRVWR